MKSGPRRTQLPSTTSSVRRTRPPQVRTSLTARWLFTATPSTMTKVPFLPGWVLMTLMMIVIANPSAATSLTGDLTKLEDVVDSALVNDRTLRLSKSLTLEALDVNKTKSVVNASRGNVLDRIIDKMEVIATTHALKVHLPELASGVRQMSSPKFLGKNSFLAGFGLGFLAFGLKKLLLPVFIGLQIVKSVLIAMFLPSILGSVGKLVGKGVTTLASASGGAGGFSGGGALGGGDTMDDFDFKDASSSSAASAAAYPDAAGSSSDLVNSYMDLNRPDQPPGTLPAAAMAVNAATANNRLAQKTSFAHGLAGGLRRPSYGLGSSPLSTNSLSDQGGSFYSRNPAHDFHKFHGIPSSSLLLAHYDPFYSPLLSRLDAVFQQLGYSTEPCRERLVCAMYKSPAKFAPFSNLVSAQLSRELNELRKPSSDNPEILRFFRYMKAAKDGQDAVDCARLYSSCAVPEQTNNSSPMAHTFHDINKLVQARHLTQTQ